MKKILCLLIIIMLMLVCIGCGSSMETVHDTKEESTSMFILIEHDVNYGYPYSIVYHKETKVMYALSQYNEFTVMVDADGKPLLWEG